MDSVTVDGFDLKNSKGRTRLNEPNALYNYYLELFQQVQDESKLFAIAVNKDIENQLGQEQNPKKKWRFLLRRNR